MASRFNHESIENIRAKFALRSDPAVAAYLSPSEITRLENSIGTQAGFMANRLARQRVYGILNDLHQRLANDPHGRHGDQHNHDPNLHLASHTERPRPHGQEDEKEKKGPHTAHELKAGFAETFEPEPQFRTAEELKKLLEGKSPQEAAKILASAEPTEIEALRAQWEQDDAADPNSAKAEQHRGIIEAVKDGRDADTVAQLFQKLTRDDDARGQDDRAASRHVHHAEHKPNVAPTGPNFGTA